jgi:hypothetical protein
MTCAKKENVTGLDFEQGPGRAGQAKREMITELDTEIKSPGEYKERVDAHRYRLIEYRDLSEGGVTTKQCFGSRSGIF